MRIRRRDSVGRRILEERNFELLDNVLPLQQYDLQIPEHRHSTLLDKAEKALTYRIPLLTASDYMLFCKTGNRSVYEEKCFARRVMLLDLALGEYLEKQERFVDKMIDVLWAILEESTWTIPAHNRYRPGTHANLPYAFGRNVDYIDLFSAATGAVIAVTYHLHKDLLDRLSPEINNRIQYELDRQLIRPYLDDEILRNKCRWSGLSGGKVNNWCPWIVTNLLTVCTFAVTDIEQRRQIVAQSLPLLDNFTAANPEDGGCDEGPRYWELAGGSLWAACALLRDMTGGYIDLFNDPMLKAMGEYEIKMIVAPGYLLNFADSPRQYIPNPYLLYHWGKSCGSQLLMDYAGWLPKEEPETDYRTPYKYLLYLTTPELPTRECGAPQRTYIESLQIAITRPSGKLGEGLYLAVKGGHNGESHNHNDLGNIVVFSDDKPIFIDVGVGEYTKRYFGPERYEIWHTCSDFHNCASLNGVTQKAGSDYRAESVVYEPTSGSLSMNLENAYPNAGLLSYRRSAVLDNDCIVLQDQVKYMEPGVVQFHFMTVVKPEQITRNSFYILGKIVEFDPLLTLCVDEPDLTIPEAEPIPGFWGVEKFYRITLTTKEKIKEHTFILTVK